LASYEYPPIRSQNLVKPASDAAKWIRGFERSKGCIQLPLEVFSRFTAPIVSVLKAPPYRHVPYRHVPARCSNRILKFFLVRIKIQTRIINSIIIKS
jgi:hypothetical protein